MKIEDFLKENQRHFGSNGSKWDSDRALDYFNRARRLLWDRSENWEGFYEYGRAYTSGKDLWLPWHLESCIDIFIEKSSSQLTRYAFSYSEIDRRNFQISESECVPIGIDCYPVGFKAYGEHPYPIDPNLEELKCFRVGVCRRDSFDSPETTVTISGIDYAGGSVTEKIQLTEARKTIYTDNEFSRITSIDKTRTLGIVDVILINSSKTEVIKSHYLFPMEKEALYSRVIFDTDIGEAYIRGKFKKRFFNADKDDYGRKLGMSPDALTFACIAVSARDLQLTVKYKENLEFAEEHLMEIEQRKEEGKSETNFHPDIV